MTTDLGETMTLAAGQREDLERRRADNARAVLAETSTPETSTDTDDLDNPTGIEQFLAVGESTIDGTLMWATAPTKTRALALVEGGDEYPQDWRPVHLFDLDDDGAAVGFTASLSWSYTFHVNTNQGA